MSTFKVLIPLDGSTFSRTILDSVDGFLKPEQHQLFLLRVTQPPAGIGNIPPRLLPLDGGAELIPNYRSSQDVELSHHPIFDTQTWENLKAEVSRELNQDIQELTTAGFKVSVLLHTGQAAEEIVQAVERNDIDLVVMATHSRQGLERLLAGSVAEYILKHVDIPVLMLHPEKNKHLNSKAIKHILIPLDKSEFSRAALQPLASIFSPKEHQLTLLHVAPVPEIDSSVNLAIPWRVGADKLSHSDLARREQERSKYYVRVTEELQKQLLEGMHSSQQLLEDAGFKVELAVRFGNPAQEITAFVNYGHVDMVVMATHSRVGLDRLMLGSVAQDVLRETHVPIMMVRPQHNVTVSSQTQILTPVT